MMILCPKCHLSMIDLQQLAVQVVVRKPRRVLIPVQLYNGSVFVCPNCDIRVIVSLPSDFITQEPGHDLHDAIRAFQKTNRVSMFYNFLDPEDAQEGLEVGFIDRIAKFGLKPT